MRISGKAIAVGSVLGIGIFVLAKKSKAAQLSSSSPSTLPSSSSSSPATPSPPALTPGRTSSAEEGQPLAWDKREHPLAERGIDPDAAAAASLNVNEVQLEGEGEPQPPIVIDIRPTDDNFEGGKAQADLSRGAKAPAEPTAPAPAPAPSSSSSAKPKPKPPAAKPPAAPTAPPAVEVMPKPGRTPVQAATALYERAQALLNQGKGSQLGTKGAPSQFVLEAQRDMGGIVADGMYGPATRDRGKKLIGKTFPVRK